MKKPARIDMAQYSDVLQRYFLAKHGRIELMSQATGIPARTVHADVHGENGKAVLRLIEYMRRADESLVNDFLALAGYGGAFRLEGQTNEFDVHVMLTRASAEFAERISDGAYCHRDRAEMRPWWRRVHTGVGALLSKEQNTAKIEVR